MKMFRQITNHKRTATVAFVRRMNAIMVTVMCDDGFEEILDHQYEVATEAEGIANLIAAGYEEYDPNAELKAKGMVFINGCYRMPA
jgi:hypothetical protein